MASPGKMIFNLIMFVASVAYQQRLYKKMRERMEAEAEKRKGFLLPVRGQAVSLPVVYGKQKIAGVQTIHKVIDSLSSVGNFNTIGYIGINSRDNTGLPVGVLPVVNLSDGETNPETIYDINSNVDSSITDQFHHAQYFASDTNTFSTAASKNSYLLMQQAICQGGINKVKHIFVDESDYNSKDAKFDHKILVYRTGGVQDSFATANGVPNTNIFTDCAFSTMIFKLNRDEPNYNGIPDVQFLVEGRKIRDIIRSGSIGSYTYAISTTYSYSNNPALVLLDYLTNDKFGRGLNSSTEIDLESFYNAKVICARNDMVYENGVATTKSIPNAGLINTTDSQTERTQSISLDVSGAFTSGNSGSVTVAMNSSHINGNGIDGVPGSVGSTSGSTITLDTPSRISFGSGKSSTFKNALVKAVVTGTSDGTTALTSQAVIMPQNTDEESTRKNYAYTVESFKTITSITFTRVDSSTNDIVTENLCIGTSKNITLPALYECNLTIDTSDTIRNNIEKILNTMGLAELTWTTEGKYKLQLEYPQTANEEQALSVALFTRENVIRDEISISYNAATERFNQVTATFSNEFEDFKDDSITFPKTGSTAHNTFLNEDNNLPMSSDVDLTGITNPYHAMAKAEQIVRTSRRINTLNITLDKTALKLEPGDFITINLVDTLDSQGYANLVNELYRVESIAVQEDLSVKVQAYCFDYNDLAWNVPDNIAYSNREYYSFSVATPTNLKYLRNGLDAYTTSINETPATITNSSGRLTWTAPNGINRFSVEVAQVLASNYSGATDSSWIGELPWSTLGETRAAFFDLPALSSLGKVTYSYYGAGTEIKTWDNTNLSNFLSGSFSAGANSIKILHPSYYKSSLQMGDGTLTAGIRHNLSDLTLVEPAYIYVRANQNYTSGGGGQGNSQANRFFVSGTDIDGNVLVDHPLQRLDLSNHHAPTGDPDWHKMITKPTFTVDPLTPTSPASDWSENVSGTDQMLCSTVLFQFIDSIKITPNAPTGYPIPTAATNASSGTGLTLDNFAVGLITRSVSHSYVQDPESLRTYADTNGSSSYPDEIVPGDANMSSGSVTSALTSTGPITFENPTHIILRQYVRTTDSSGLTVTLLNNSFHRIFIDGIDEYGNTLIGYPLQRIDHTGISYNDAVDGNWTSTPKVAGNLIWAYGPSGDWRESERLFPNANGQDSNYGDPWSQMNIAVGSIPDGYTVMTGVALSRLDKIYFTDTMTPAYDSGAPSAGGINYGDAQPPPYAPYPSQRLDSTSSGSMGQFRIGTITKTYNKPEGNFAFSVKSISTGGYTSARATTLGVTDANPTSPTLENVNQNVSQVTVIFADSANQGNNNQSFTTTVNGSEATHMATVVHADQLEPLPIRPETRILNFVRIKGSDGASGADGIATTTVRLYYTIASAGDPTGSTTFTGVTLTWATGLLDTSTIPSNWSQTAPTVTANNTDSFWFVDLVFTNTTGATTSTPSSIGTVQKVISFNNLVLFTGSNTTFTDELITSLGSGNNAAVNTAVNNNVTSISGNQITTGTIQAAKIVGRGITTFLRTSGQDLYNMNPGNPRTGTGVSGYRLRRFSSNILTRTYINDGSVGYDQGGTSGYGVVRATASFDLWGLENFANSTATPPGSFNGINVSASNDWYVYEYQAYLEVFQRVGNTDTVIAAVGVLTNDNLTPGSSTYYIGKAFTTKNQGISVYLTTELEATSNTAQQRVFARLSIERTTRSGSGIGTYTHVYRPKIDLQEFTR